MFLYMLKIIEIEYIEKVKNVLELLEEVDLFQSHTQQLLLKWKLSIFQQTHTGQ